MENINPGQEQKKNPFTTVTPLSKVLALMMLVLLPFIGFFLGTKYNEQSCIVRLSEQPEKKPETANGTPKIGVVGEGITSEGWENYTSEKLGISFSYPTNLINPQESEDTIVFNPITPKGPNDTGPMKILKLIDTTTTDWLEKNDEIEKAQSGTYFSAKEWNTDITTFKGYKAYLFTPKENAQVPNNILSVEVNNNVYQISYETTFPKTDIPIYVISNKEFLENTKPIIDIILDSIKFL